MAQAQVFLVAFRKGYRKTSINAGSQRSGATKRIDECISEDIFGKKAKLLYLTC